MRTKAEPPESKFLGWVVEYANDPRYKGANAYLLVRDWQKWEAASTHSYSTCTVFEDREQAVRWATHHHALLGEGHLTPEVIPIWRISAFTLEDPNRERRMEKLKTEVCTKVFK